MLAQYAQEVNQDSKIILDDVEHVLKLWLRIDIQSCSADSHLERGSENALSVWCYIN